MWYSDTSIHSHYLPRCCIGYRHSFSNSVLLCRIDWVAMRQNQDNSLNMVYYLLLHKNQHRFWWETERAKGGRDSRFSITVWSCDRPLGDCLLSMQIQSAFIHSVQSIIIYAFMCSLVLYVLLLIARCVIVVIFHSASPTKTGCFVFMKINSILAREWNYDMHSFDKWYRKYTHCD